MKKPLRWLLGILAGLVLAVGALIWDLDRRAEMGIQRRHQESLEEIAALRVRLSQRGSSVREWNLYTSALEILDSPFDTPEKVALELLLRTFLARPEHVRAAHQRNTRGAFLPYELGHEAESYVGLLIHSSLRLRDFSAPHLLVALAFIQEIGRGSGPDTFSRSWQSEMKILEEWERRLISGAPPAADLAFFAAGLDRLKEARPAVEDTHAAGYLIWRRHLIRLARHETPLSGFPDAPDWRSFYSRKVHFLRLLNMAEDDERELAPSSFLRNQTARLEGLWDHVRTRTAIEWHRTERNAYPRRLRDLVPRYLPRVPDGIDPLDRFLGR